MALHDHEQNTELLQTILKINNPSREIVSAATRGDLTALDTLLATIQPGIFNLAYRMLGNRDDAADASQEIFLRIVTHLGTFRGESAFSTWAYKVARNHLLNASTRSKESPEISLESIAGDLQSGLDFAAAHLGAAYESRTLTPEDKVEARQVAIACTQKMLLALDREQRLVYLLDVVFGLSSIEAAEVIGITAEAYRQRLSRTKAQLNGFVVRVCGLANPEADCRCERQLPAIRHVRAASPTTHSTILVRPEDVVDAEAQFNTIVRMTDAVAVFRSHPDYQPPQSQLAGIRIVLANEGFLDKRRVQ